MLSRLGNPFTPPHELLASQFCHFVCSELRSMNEHHLYSYQNFPKMLPWMERLVGLILPALLTKYWQLFGGRGNFQDTVSVVKTMNSPHWKTITFQVHWIKSIEVRVNSPLRFSIYHPKATSLSKTVLRSSNPCSVLRAHMNAPKSSFSNKQRLKAMTMF